MLFKLKLKRPNAIKSSLMTEFMKNGVPFKLYTGKTIHTKNWSPSKQAVLSGEENYDIINKYLDNWKIETNRIIETLQADKVRLTKEEIQIQLDKAFKKDYIEKKEDTINDFTSFMDFYLDKKKDKKRNLQRLNQVKKLVLVAFNLVSKKHLAEWQKLSSSQKSRTNLKADKKLSFEDVNLKFIEKFREYMFTAKFTVSNKGKKVEKNYKINYIDKQIKTLKQIVSSAIESGFVLPFTWHGIKSEKKDVDTVYTDFNEIQMLNDEQLTKKTEILVRDKYVLNCFLGMRYSDLNKLEPHFFTKKNIAGKEFLVYTGRAKKQIIKLSLQYIQLLNKFWRNIISTFQNYPQKNSTMYSKLLPIKLD